MIDDLVAGGCDLIVYFTDYDTIVEQGKADKFSNIVEKYSKNEEVLICESMPSIIFIPKYKPAKTKKTSGFLLRL